VIETSGVADPSDIVRNLMDPLSLAGGAGWKLCCAWWTRRHRRRRLNDARLRSQLRAADVVAAEQGGPGGAAGRAQLRDAVRVLRPAACWSMLCMACPRDAAAVSPRTQTACRRRASRGRDGRRLTGSRR